MKKIETIIRHYKLKNVKQALTDFGVDGMTIAERKQTKEAAAALRTISRIVKSIVPTT